MTLGAPEYYDATVLASGLWRKIASLHHNAFETEEMSELDVQALHMHFDEQLEQQRSKVPKLVGLEQMAQQVLTESTTELLTIQVTLFYSHWLIIPCRRALQCCMYIHTAYMNRVKHCCIHIDTENSYMQFKITARHQDIHTILNCSCRSVSTLTLK